MRRTVLLSLFLAVTALGKPLLVDGTAARVGKTLISVRDAYFFRAVHRFREGTGDPLNVESGDELRRTVQKMIFEEMILAEMQSFRFKEGERADAEKALAARRAASSGQWQRLLSRYGKGEAAAVDVVYRSQQADRFLQKKVETLTPVVTDAEIERYYNQTYLKGGKGRLQEGEYEALKPKIVLLLKKERMQKGLEEWVRFLRDKYGVTNFLSAG